MKGKIALAAAGVLALAGLAALLSRRPAPDGWETPVSDGAEAAHSDKETELARAPAGDQQKED